MGPVAPSTFASSAGRRPIPMVRARQIAAVCAVLAEKCAIYAQGLRRRGREVDAASVAEVSARANNSWREPGGSSIHDAIASTLPIIAPEASGVSHEASRMVAETAA